jgi:hypothetical protein
MEDVKLLKKSMGSKSKNKVMVVKITVYLFIIFFSYIYFSQVARNWAQYQHATSEELYKQQKKKCAMTFKLLPQNTAIPSTVISSNMTQVESLSIVNNLFSSCNSGSDIAFNIHQEKVNNYNFPEIQNCNISDTPNFKETLNNSSTNLCDKLRYWILQYKVSHSGVDSLLSILRSEGINVPKDVRTLMNTPKTKEITNITNESYIHLGFQNVLLPLLKINNANIHITDNELKVGINIDGLPISRSSKSQLWPILISILNCNSNWYISWVQETTFH